MYESYGGVVNRPLKDGPGYAGNMTDSVTGLSHMQQRDFDSSVGTFLSMDPATTVENPYANFQRYRYGNGNPYKFVDPDDADATYFQMLVFWLFRLILRVRPQQNPM
ncbi:tRNA(Glu)-specific nuclease WapA precursor [compost metagenome]